MFYEMLKIFITELLNLDIHFVVYFSGNTLDYYNEERLIIVDVFDSAREAKNFLRILKSRSIDENDEELRLSLRNNVLNIDSGYGYAKYEIVKLTKETLDSFLRIEKGVDIFKKLNIR